MYGNEKGLKKRGIFSAGLSLAGYGKYFPLPDPSRRRKREGACNKTSRMRKIFPVRDHPTGKRKGVLPLKCPPQHFQRRRLLCYEILKGSAKPLKGKRICCR